jgi:hypothetical protein
MADRSLVDAALLELLANDAPLAALCPDGAFWDLAPAGAKAFVLAGIVDGTETPGLDSTTLYESTIYLVKAVVLTSGGSVTRNAAARIHQLLQHADLDLAAAGYSPMVLKRIEPIRYTEVDPIEKSARWQHRGGQYELLSYPTD